MMKKRVLILGSTGTIGVNTLKVIERFSDRFEVVGLTAYNNVDVLVGQIKTFKPKYVAVHSRKRNDLLKRLGNVKVLVRDADHDLNELCSLDECDIVVIGMSGSAALEPFMACARSGKMIAPANKEALVIAGHILMKLAQENSATIIPVDSEQSAIFQCLEGQDRRELSKVYLTASGGALHGVPMDKFDRLTVKEILDHPRWKMGQKITVDSALMMNKGFEVIEAQRLFGLTVDQIEVVVHPQAVIHSMVSFQDGSILAQMGVADMRLPIQYALTYPERWPSSVLPLDLFEFKNLTFEKPDEQKFPALGLARMAARQGGTMASVLNAADEQAVQAFLNGRIRFTDIYVILERVLGKHKNTDGDTIGDILDADAWARSYTDELIGKRCEERILS